jgi:quercetin dioxygenase-like cupin family protein
VSSTGNGIGDVQSEMLQEGPNMTLHGDPHTINGQVVRHVLSASHPLSAPGETLELVQYTIPAGAKLPVHKHPGVQMATVESGTLTYHVIHDGSVTVNRADGTAETIGPGQVTAFRVGDSWVEPVGMVHFAENLTDVPIVLMSSSLLDDDVPSTELVNEAAGPEYG